MEKYIEPDLKSIVFNRLRTLCELLNYIDEEAKGAIRDMEVKIELLRSLLYNADLMDEYDEWEAKHFAAKGTTNG
jgi:hypothetical protein